MCVPAARTSHGVLDSPNSVHGSEGRLRRRHPAHRGRRSGGGGQPQRLKSRSRPAPSTPSAGPRSARTAAAGAPVWSSRTVASGSGRTLCQRAAGAGTPGVRSASTCPVPDASVRPCWSSVHPPVGAAGACRILGVSRAFGNTSAAIPAHPVPTTGPLIRQLHRLAQPPSHQSRPQLFVTAGPHHRAVVAGTAAVLAWGRGGAVPLPGSVRARPDLHRLPHVAVDRRASDAEPRVDGLGRIGASRWLRRRLTNTRHSSRPTARRAPASLNCHTYCLLSNGDPDSRASRSMARDVIPSLGKIWYKCAPTVRWERNSRSADLLVGQAGRGQHGDLQFLGSQYLPVLTVAARPAAAGGTQFFTGAIRPHPGPEAFECGQCAAERASGLCGYPGASQALAVGQLHASQIEGPLARRRAATGLSSKSRTASSSLVAHNAAEPPANRASLGESAAMPAFAHGTYVSGRLSRTVGTDGCLHQIHRHP